MELASNRNGTWRKSFSLNNLKIQLRQTVFVLTLFVMITNIEKGSASFTESHREHFYRRMNFGEYKRRFYSGNIDNHLTYEITALAESNKKIKSLYKNYPFLEKYSIHTNEFPTEQYKISSTVPTTLPNDGFTTGMWAVKLKFGKANATRDRLDQAADNIAEEHGLTNHGQIGELKGDHANTNYNMFAVQV